MSPWWIALACLALAALVAVLRTRILALHRRVFVRRLLPRRPAAEGPSLSRPRSRRGEPTREQAVCLAARLERYMEQERPWLEEDLRLEDLATALGISRHRLSRVLSQHLATRFHDFVNRFRVAEARRLLTDPSWTGSVMDTGLAAGFGSNASFYRAFRRFVGETPKAFAGRHRGSLRS